MPDVPEPVTCDQRPGHMGWLDCPVHYPKRPQMDPPQDERRYTLSLSWDEVAFLQSILGACSDIALNFAEPELSPFAGSVVVQVNELARQAREEHYPQHTPTCACQLCIQAYGPVDQRKEAQ